MLPELDGDKVELDTVAGSGAAGRRSVDSQADTGFVEDILQQITRLMLRATTISRRPTWIVRISSLLIRLRRRSILLLLLLWWPRLLRSRIWSREWSASRRSSVCLRLDLISWGLGRWRSLRRWHVWSLCPVGLAWSLRSWRHLIGSARNVRWSLLSALWSIWRHLRLLGLWSHRLRVVVVLLWLRHRRHWAALLQDVWRLKY